jgi:hypothetical protein
MVDEGGGRGRRDREAALGGLLLVLGVLVLAGQALDLDLGRVGWPVLVILPGLGLLGLGLTSQGRPGEVLAMAGGLITMVGLVLGVQHTTDRFETWSYAWTLLVVGAGAGRWLAGTTRGRHDLAAGGGWLIAVGLAAFLAFAVLFEAVIGLGGRTPGGAGRSTLAVLLILAGLVLLGRRLLPTRRP